MADCEYLVAHLVEVELVDVHRQRHLSDDLRLARIDEYQPALVVSAAGDHPFTVALKLDVLHQPLAFVAAAQDG